MVSRDTRRSSHALKKEETTVSEYFQTSIRVIKGKRLHIYEMTKVTE